MKLDFHIHTDASPCSNMSLESAVKTSIKQGLQGFAVCNHNLPFTLSNKDELEKKFNITINPTTPVESPFYIISGIELSVNKSHILGLFLTGADNISSPEEILSNGGVIALAHPFQHSKNYEERLKELKFSLNFSPLVECASGRANYKNKRASDQARDFALAFNLKTCGGSDAHFPEEIGNAYIEMSDVVGIDAIKNELLSGRVQLYSKNAKRRFIAKSQIIKHGCRPKTILFYIYSLVRDFGDIICQK